MENRKISPRPPPKKENMWRKKIYRTKAPVKETMTKEGEKLVINGGILCSFTGKEERYTGRKIY